MSTLSSQFPQPERSLHVPFIRNNAKLEEPVRIKISKQQSRRSRPRHRIQDTIDSASGEFTQQAEIGLQILPRIQAGNLAGRGVTHKHVDTVTADSRQSQAINSGDGA